MTERLKTIGIFGGTFDPIHCGHLRAGLEIYETLSLNEMRLIPGKHPPHRSTPKASPEHRLNMARLGIQGSPLQIDDCEMRREGPSYSIDTLMALRREYPKASLCMVVGVDAFLGLTSWFQWEKFIQLANIIVMYRAGWSLPKTGITAELLQSHALASKNLDQVTCGYILTQKITTLEISASQIRNLIEQKRSPAFLLPKSVHEYIQQNKLYGYDENDTMTPKEDVHL